MLKHCCILVFYFNHWAYTHAYRYLSAWHLCSFRLLAKVVVVRTCGQKRSKVVVNMYMHVSGGLSVHIALELVKRNQRRSNVQCFCDSKTHFRGVVWEFEYIPRGFKGFK